VLLPPALAAHHLEDAVVLLSLGAACTSLDVHAAAFVIALQACN
jgi:hypothetical protein